MKKICYIVSAGECAGININKNIDDYIIAVDGGYKYLLDSKIEPDMILGDFDSLGYVPKGENVIVHQTEKDDTDTMLAVKEGISRGYREFMIYGALGGRIDHSYANYQVLTFLSKNGYKASLISDDAVVTAVTNGKVVLKKQEQGLFSVFSTDEESKGVTIKGGKYEIEKGTLTNCRALGISNEFVGKEVEIAVEDGTLLIFT